MDISWLAHAHVGSTGARSGQVPSLVEKEGQFAGRFRLDLSRAEDVVFDEAVRELRAQLDRCIRILGRVPDTGGGGRGNSPWGRAVRQVNDEYGLAVWFRR